MNDSNPRDFITVDSFSQLPFNRRPIKPPPPPPPPPPNIRLFGFNFSSASGPTDSKRKFECNYCCRNFPTSQALGGHQNAHKRERQQAKRAHMYGAAVGYHRADLPVVVPATRFPFSHPAAQFHPSWNAAAPPPAGLGSAARPIIGNPLTDMWRIQAAGGEVGCCCADSASSSSASPKKEGPYDPRKDGVSLDLHL